MAKQRAAVVNESGDVENVIVIDGGKGFEIPGKVVEPVARGVRIGMRRDADRRVYIDPEDPGVEVPQVDLPAKAGGKP